MGQPKSMRPYRGRTYRARETRKRELNVNKSCPYNETTPQYQRNGNNNRKDNVRNILHPKDQTKGRAYQQDVRVELFPNQRQFKYRRRYQQALAL